MTLQTHLLCGPIAAGKSTFALVLADQEGALLFSIDKLMIRLYAPDAPTALTTDWYEPSVPRCEEQIFTTVKQAARRAVPSVLYL